MTVDKSAERARATERPDRRMVANGELLAIDPRALIKGPSAFFWMFGPMCPPPKRIGDTCIVYVRGGLEQHADGYSCSYESIIDDVKCAREGDDPAKRVVLAIDSPGGVVSGLYEAVDELRKLVVDAVYVEGLCASAAYALACASKRIIVPGSAILGSVGVIATMYSQARRDKAMGIDVVTIASGKRKTDGNPHVQISDNAIKAERRRVQQFADGFFEIVQDARGFDAEPYEAGLFVGKDAIKAGFADKLGTLAEFVASQEKTLAIAAGEVTQSDTPQSGTPESNMRLSTKIKETKKALAASKDEAEKSRLRSELASLKHSAALLADTEKKTYEKETSEKSTDEDDEEEEAEEDGDEEEAEEEDAEEDAESDGEEEDAESEEDEKKAEDDKEEKKAIAAAKKLKGKAGAAILSALTRASAKRKAMRAELKGTRRLEKTVSGLVAENARRDRDVVISGALSAGRITPAEAKDLRKQSNDYVGAFLNARPNAIVNSGNLGADIKQSASIISSRMGNVPPAAVSAEITNEMREAGERIAQLTNGKVTAKAAIDNFQAGTKAPEKY